MRRRQDAIATSETTSTPTTGPTLPGEPDLFAQARAKTAAAMEDRSSIGEKTADPPKKPSPAGFTPPKMPEPYERIVTTIFDVPDPAGEFQRLRDELELSGIKPSRADYGTVVDALDQAEKNAQAAVELYANFDLAHEGFLIDELVIRGAYRERAKVELENQKREEFEKNKSLMGSKASAGKQITEDDVAAEMARLFPDEARVLAERRAQAHGAKAACKALAERWAERAKDLRAMVSTTRAASTAHYGS